MSKIHMVVPAEMAMLTETCEHSGVKCVCKNKVYHVFLRKAGKHSLVGRYDSAEEAIRSNPEFEWSSIEDMGNVPIAKGYRKEKLK